MKQQNNILLAAGAALLLLVFKKKREQVAGVGAAGLNPLKAISLIQQADIWIEKPIPNLTEAEKRKLDKIADKLNYKLPKRYAKVGYSYGEAMLKQVQPLYKKISIQGIGSIGGWDQALLDELRTSYPIVDRDGRELLIFRDYTNSPAYERFIESFTFRAENSLAKTSSEGYLNCLHYISVGGKFVWESITSELLGRDSKLEKKNFKSILGNASDGAKTILGLAHSWGQGGDDREVANGIIECLREGWTKQTAKKELLRLAEQEVRSEIERQKAMEDESNNNPNLDSGEDLSDIDPNNLIDPDDNEPPF